MGRVNLFANFLSVLANRQLADRPQNFCWRFLQNCPLKIFLAIDRHYCIYTPQSRIGWQNFCLKILRVSICVSSTTSASIFNKYSTLPNFSIVNLQMSLLAKLVIFYFPWPSLNIIVLNNKIHLGDTVFRQLGLFGDMIWWDMFQL